MALGGRDILKLIVDADAKGAVREFENVGNAAEKNLKKADSGLEKVSSGMQKWGAAAAVAGGVVAGGLIKAANKFEDTALAAGKFSEATGLGVEAASRYIAIADDIGVGAGTIQTAFQKMEVGMGNNKKAFADLGIEIAKNKDGSANLSETFLRVIDTLQKIEDPTKRAAAAQAIFGKGYAEVAELINTSSAKIRTALSSVSDAQVITPAELDRAKEYRAAVDNLGDAFGDLVTTIGGGAAPVISTVANTIAGLVNAVQALPPPVKDGVGKILALGSAALIAGGSVVFLAGKIASLIDKSRGLTSTLGSVSPKLGAGFAGAAGEIGIAVTAFIALDEVGKAWTHTAERVADVTQKATASIGKDGMAKAMSEFKQEAGTQRSLFGGIAEGVQGIGIDFLNLVGATDQTSQSFLDQADDNRAAQAAMKQGLPFFRAYIDGQKELGVNVDGLEAKYKTWIAATANVSTAQQQVQTDIEAAGNAAAGSTGKFDAAGNAIATVGMTSQKAAELSAQSFGTFEQRAAGIGHAMDEQAASIAKAEAALRSHTNAVLEATGSALGVSAAQRDFNQAVIDADKTLKDSKATTDDKAAALDRETQAALDTATATVNYAEKQAEAQGKTLSAKEANDILIGTLYGLANKASPAVQQALGDTITKLQDVGAQHPKPTVEVVDKATAPINGMQTALDVLNRSSANIAIHADVSPAKAAINGLIRGINSITAFTGGGKIAQIAKGTRDFPGGLALVGERGPELAFLPKGTAVKTAAETKSIMDGPTAMAMPTSGRSSRPIVINVNGAVVDQIGVGRAVKQAIAAAERAGVN